MRAVPQANTFCSISLAKKKPKHSLHKKILNAAHCAAAGSGRGQQESR